MEAARARRRGAVDAPTYAAVRALVDELVRAGVRARLHRARRALDAAGAGDRRTTRDLRVWSHVDERSAAFFALGLARAARGAGGGGLHLRHRRRQLPARRRRGRTGARAAAAADRRPAAGAARLRRLPGHRSAQALRRLRQVVLRGRRGERRPALLPRARQPRRRHRRGRARRARAPQPAAARTAGTRRIRASWKRESSATGAPHTACWRRDASPSVADAGRDRSPPARAGSSSAARSTPTPTTPRRHRRARRGARLARCWPTPPRSCAPATTTARSSSPPTTPSCATRCLRVAWRSRPPSAHRSAADLEGAAHLAARPARLPAGGRRSGGRLGRSAAGRRDAGAPPTSRRCARRWRRAAARRAIRAGSTPGGTRRRARRRRRGHAGWRRSRCRFEGSRGRRAGGAAARRRDAVVGNSMAMRDLDTFWRGARRAASACCATAAPTASMASSPARSAPRPRAAGRRWRSPATSASCTTSAACWPPSATRCAPCSWSATTTAAASSPTCRRPTAAPPSSVCSSPRTASTSAAASRCTAAGSSARRSRARIRGGARRRRCRRRGVTVIEVPIDLERSVALHREAWAAAAERRPRGAT